MGKEKPKVGDILYSLNIGNEVSKWNPQKLTKVEVVKVGRKYFYCLENNMPEDYSVKYYLSDWRHVTEYSEQSCLYKTKHEWEIEKESSRICDRVYQGFLYGRNELNLPIATLRKINLILDGCK